MVAVAAVLGLGVVHALAVVRSPQVAAAGSASSTAASDAPAEAQAALVERIVDGDTLVLRAAPRPGDAPVSTRSIIRLLEVDTPETKRPGTPVQCYGPEATAFIAASLPVGSPVLVARDRDPVDRFGRRLLYVWTASGEFINREIVRTGHGRAVLYPPNDRHIAEIRAAEAEARAAGRGLWARCS
jgi:micrococcal nuclease